MSILAVPGAVGSLVANGSDAVDITGSTFITVTFRNLVFREIDNNYNWRGIFVNNANASVLITNSEFDLFFVALLVNSWNMLDVSHSAFYGTEKNGWAISVDGSAANPQVSRVTIDHSEFRQNGSFQSSGGDGGIYLNNVAANLSHNTMSNGWTEVFVDSGASVVLDDNLITGNLVGVYVNGNAYSLGNNNIEYNSASVFNGNLTKISAQ